MTREHLALSMRAACILISLSALASAQVQRTTPWIVQGHAAHDDFGREMIPLADVNGNGAMDIAFGIPRDSQTQLLSGAVELRDGMTGQLIWRNASTEVNGGQGVHLVALDDTNADGVRDIATTEFSASQGHRIRILSGADGSLLRQALLATYAAGVVRTLTEIDDISGDGIRDIAVGLYDASAMPGPGAVGFVAIDSVDLSLLRSSTPSGMTSSLPALASVRGPDVTGDGVSELYVGDPIAMGIAGNTGAVWIVDGDTLVTAGNVPGIVCCDWMGWSVAVYDDVTGDGVREILAGAPGTGFPGQGGHVAVVDPAARSVVSIITAPSGLVQFGHSVASRQIAGLAQSTILVGCAEPSNQPGTPRTLAVEATLQGNLVTRFVENTSHEQYAPATVRAVGDLNLDGIPDLAVRAVPNDAVAVAKVFLYRTPGLVPYGSGNPAVHTLSLGTAGLNPNIAILRLLGGSPTNIAWFLFSVQRADVPALGGALLVDLSLASASGWIAESFSSGGAAFFVVDFNVSQALQGYSLHVQGLELNAAAPQGAFASDGLQITF